MAVFILTVVKSYKLNKAQDVVGRRSQLAILLMRDGSLYFAMMAASNIFNCFVLLRGDISSSVSVESVGNSSVLTHTISVTMISRLVLNLRALSVCDSHDPTVSRYSTWIARDIDMLASYPSFSGHSVTSEAEFEDESIDIYTVSRSDEAVDSGSS